MNRIEDKFIDYVVIWIVIITCIKPDGISYLAPAFEKIIYGYGSIIGFLFSFFLFFIYAIKRKNVTKIVIILFLFIGYMLLVTALKRGPIEKCINMWLRPVAVLCLFEAYRNKLFKTLHLFEIVLFIFTFINLICMLQYPDGMYVMEGTNYTACWFLGYKSSFQYYFLPLITISALFAYYRKKHLSFAFIIIIVHIETILAGNLMFFIVLVIFDVLLYFRFIRNTVLFNINNYMKVVIGANILFIFFFSAIFNIQPVYYFFNDILGKNFTLMIRVNIWTKGISYITKEIIFGYGYTTGAEMLTWFGISQVHLHNQWLMTLLQTGIVGSLILLIFFVVCFRSLMNNKEIYVSKLMSLSMFCLFISVIVEIFISSASSTIWPLMFVGYYSKSMDWQASQSAGKYRLPQIRFK